MPKNEAARRQKRKTNRDGWFGVVAGYRADESKERAVTTLKKLFYTFTLFFQGFPLSSADEIRSQPPAGEPKPPAPGSPPARLPRAELAAALQPLSPPGNLNLALWPSQKKGTDGLSPILGTPLGSLSHARASLHTPTPAWYVVRRPDHLPAGRDLSRWL